MMTFKTGKRHVNKLHKYLNIVQSGRDFKILYRSATLEFAAKTCSSFSRNRTAIKGYHNLNKE